MEAENASVPPTHSALTQLKREASVQSNPEGQRIAAEAQQTVAAAAEAVSDEQKKFVSPSWDGNGGPAMEALLENTTLIDINYYISLAKARGILPQWNQIPQAAKIGSHNVWRLRCWDHPLVLPVLCWTYGWLSPEHPDPRGEQLRMVLPILEVMLAYAKKEFGEHATIGVLQDYASYPQAPRSPEEDTRFSRGLKTELNYWYTHPFTICLMVTLSMSESPEHTNRRPYDQRGWCYVEKRLSSMVKDKNCLWDFSKYQGGQEFHELQDQMKADRPPMVSPERVAKEMRDGVDSGSLAFTARADMDFVIGLYERGFREAFQTYVRVSGRTFIEQKCLGWGDEEAVIVAEALKYVEEHCQVEMLEGEAQSLMIDLRGNPWSNGDIIKAVVAQSKKIRVRA